MRRILASTAAFAVLSLAASETQAWRAFPTRHLGSINPQQQAEMFQALLQITDPLTAQRASINPLVIDRRGTPPRVNVLLLEDQPGEIGPLGVVVIGNTVQDADVFQLTGDGEIQRDPAGTVHIADGAVLLFQGTPSVNDPMLLLARLRF